MRKKHIIRTSLVILAICGAVLTFGHPSGQPAASDSSCKEAMDACPKQQQGGKMIWENLSHQFFSSL